MLCNMSFNTTIARNADGIDTYGGLPFAGSVPQRWTTGLYIADYVNYHLLIKDYGRIWEEYPDLTRFGEQPSFGVYDNVDQIVDSPLFRKIQDDRSANYCFVAVNANYGIPATQDLIPNDFGKYFGSRHGFTGISDRSLRNSGLYCCFYSVFRYIQ